MLCKICDLSVRIPATGDMPERCRQYLITDKGNSADIIIRADLYDYDKYPLASEETTIYMESGRQFYSKIIIFDGILLHSSAVEYDGKAYLFSGPSGRGKSTHTKLWQNIYGNKAQVFNDDKPALRRIDGKWYAYGTPWCGKDGINQNKKVPLGGICFLKRGNANIISKMSISKAIAAIMGQTIYSWSKAENLNIVMDLMDNLIREIPIFELECLPNEEAAILSSTTMCRAAQEANL